MKLTVKQLRKLVEFVVKESKKRSLKESNKVTCPECGSDEIEFDLLDLKHERKFNECQDCGCEFAERLPDSDQYDEEDAEWAMYHPDFEVGTGKEPKKLKRW